MNILFAGGRNFTIDRRRFSLGGHGLQVFVTVLGFSLSDSTSSGFIIKGIIIILVIIINLCNVEHKPQGKKGMIVWFYQPKSKPMLKIV